MVGNIRNATSRSRSFRTAVDVFIRYPANSVVDIRKVRAKLAQNASASGSASSGGNFILNPGAFQRSVNGSAVVANNVEYTDAQVVRYELNP